MIDTLINAVVGMAVVFAVLILLMAIISIMSKIMKTGNSKKTEAPVATAPSSAAKPAVAPGSCGEVKIFDVPDKTAAQLMAITADKLDVPLNTLRFISIKEVK